MLLPTLVLFPMLIQGFKLPLVDNYYYDNQGDAYMHRHKRAVASNQIKKYDIKEETADYWYNQAQATLTRQLLKQEITGLAKNVILFLGDGMSISTLTAARTYLGQKQGKTGEETKFSFEEFPFVGLSKTYCVDRQVADSACSATAYLCGVKANEGTIGVTAAVPLGDCEASQDPNTHLESIARLFQKEGRSAGLVTTTRVTHASPAALYSSTADRDWESDTEVNDAHFNTDHCPDIADQLIKQPTGKNLKVILGGGRAKFLPKTHFDNDGNPGNRSDDRNLIEEWQNLKDGTHRYVWNREALLNVSPDTEYLLGLFAADHVPYNIDRDPNQTPSLAEMAETAIKLLSKDNSGYFLFVEGGRIDHAHHDTRARKALDETVEFHKAVEVALNLTNTEDTLIVVTSDHAHTMTVNGYSSRGNDILGRVDTNKNLTYATLSYANGPGYHPLENGQQHIWGNDFGTKDYQYPTGYPLKSETHGGDDVAIFALGPWAHLFVGVLEQNVIPHLIAYAACVGNGTTACEMLPE